MQPDVEYFAHLKEGRFAIQRSRSSGRYVFYPRVAEPGTGAQDLEWVEASGLGTVYAMTVIHPKPPTEPYNVVLIDLDEGPRLMSRVENLGGAELAIGMRVKARIIAGEDGREPYVVFDPA
jgi:uncharacterized OB-fold protein